MKKSKMCQHGKKRLNVFSGYGHDGGSRQKASWGGAFVAVEANGGEVKVHAGIRSWVRAAEKEEERFLAALEMTGGASPYINPRSD